jgi:hypothetical protein
MVYTTHNPTFDAQLQLKDVTAAITSTATAQVGGSDAVIDLMPGAPANAPVKFIKGVVFLDVTAIDIASNDEGYTMVVQGTNTAGFGGTVYEIGRRVLGANAATGIGANSVIGRYPVYFDNVAAVAAGEYQPQRYIRLRAVIAGTTPSITYTAWAAYDV